MNSTFMIYFFIGGGCLMLFFTLIMLITKSISNVKKHSNLINEHIENTVQQYQNNNTFANVTTTQQTTKTIYQNGEKVSEVVTTTHNNVSPITNCPNCGAKIIDQSKSNCDYCHTALH